MKEKDNHIELIKRYFSGDASRIDQRSLEEVVKEYDYARDAKEGIDKMSKVNRKTSFSNLEQRLSERVNNRSSTVSLPWMKLAAGLAILVAGAFFVMRSFGDSSTVTAAKMESPADNSAIAPNSRSTRKINASQTVEENVSTSVEIEGNPFEKNGSAPTVDGIAIKPAAPNLAKAKSTIEAATPLQKTNNQGIAEAAVSDQNITNLPASTAPSAESTPLETIAMDMAGVNSDDISFGSESLPASVDLQQNGIDGLVGTTAGAINAKAIKQSTRDIKGKILDDSGKPLFGASVTIGSAGSITNLKGDFILTVSSDAKEVTVSSPGYVSKTQKLRAADQYEIYLERGEDDHSEVVVIGYNGSSYSASPVDGFTAFKKYITDNLQYPAEAKAANIKGKVVLLFNVAPSGRPRDIEVRKSLGYGCDKEATRLLVKGANWKPGTQSGKNRIAIKFK